MKIYEYIHVHKAVDHVRKTTEYTFTPKWSTEEDYHINSHMVLENDVVTVHSKDIPTGRELEIEDI